MSQVWVKKTIGMGEQSPFVVKYRNVSSEDLGIQSESKRVLRIVIEVVGGVRATDMMFVWWTNEDQYSLQEPFIHDIEFLPLKSEASFSGTFSFCNSDIAPFSTAQLWASLFIGSLEDPSRSFQKIQERNFSIQCSLNFNPNPESEFILVPNSTTTAEVIQKWVEFGRQFNLRFDIWNQGYFKTASYFKKTQTGKSLAQHAQGKLIVILNDKFPTEQGEDSTTTMGFVEQDDVLDAAIHFNVSTLVIGEEWNVEGSITPLQRSQREIIHQSLQDFYKTIERDGIQFEEDHKVALYLRTSSSNDSTPDIFELYDATVKPMVYKIEKKFPHLRFMCTA